METYLKMYLQLEVWKSFLKMGLAMIQEKSSSLLMGRLEPIEETMPNKVYVVDVG